MSNQKKQNALVSIIIATYRRDETLYDALCSLAKQTYKNIEIVLIDDNADSEWNARVKNAVSLFNDKYSVSINYIINDKNLGSAATRNRGIFAAEGEYITFLDDDDLYLPEKVENQLNDMITKNADYGITDLYLYNSENKIIDKRIRSYIVNESMEDLIRYHILYHMTGTDTLMFKTAYLKKIGAFPKIDVGDEFYLMKEAVLGKGNFCYSPHCYVKAYIHTGEDGGLSSGQKKIDGENALYEEKRKYFGYLNNKEIKYVIMRHYAVIAFTQLRRKRVIPFFINSLKAFVSSPVDCVKMFINRK